MGGSFGSGRYSSSRRGGSLLGIAVWLLVIGATSCSSSDSVADDAGVAQTSASNLAEPSSTSVDDSASDDSASDDSSGGSESAAMTGSGPGGVYLVGDTFTDIDFAFTYEGLVKVPLDTLGEYSDGECFFAVGTVTFLEGPLSEITDRDAFSPAFDPIIAGAPDTEQNDEFFNCDARVVGDLGYQQASTTDVAVGESTGVWLDAIHLTPDQVGQLEGFRIYASDDLVFAADVTSDISG